jgi:hypothetical protein
MKGQRVNTLEELVFLAEERRSVLLPPRMSQRPWPAAVIINMNLMQVYHLLIEGIHIYIREPKAKKKSKTQ